MKKRQIEFDLLRLVAMIAVIVTHVCGSQIHDLPVTSSDFIWLNVIRAALTWDVPIFVMISGRFFLSPEKKITLHKLYTKYIKHLIIVFFIWSAVYTGYFIATKYTEGNSILKMWKEYVFEFLTGPYHMWYIFMIIALYIVIPILRKISEDKQVMEYFIVLFFLAQFLQQYGVKLPILGELITAVLGKTYFYIALGYTGYFVLGYYLYRYSISARKEIILYIATGICILFSCLGTTFQSTQSGELNEFISTYQTPNIIIESCGIYVFFIKKRYRVEFSENVATRIGIFGEWGLGIYLVHALMLELLSFTGVKPTFITPIVGVTIMTILVFLMSMLVVWIIQKIPVLKKYMI